MVRSACIGHCTRFISIPLFRPIPSATDSIIAERFCNATYLQFLLAWRWLGRDVECSIRSCIQLQISLFSILYYSSGLSPSAAAAVDADVAFAATVNTPKCVQLERERCQSDVCHESPVWGRNISCIKTRSYASNRWERAFSLCSPPLTATMIFQSLLPPIHDPPFPNAHHLFLNRPDQAEWQDYDLHVDAPIGKARKWFEFKDRVKRGATAFRDPSLFPREENEIVGILGENCAVSSVSFYSASCADIKAPWVWMCVGICGAYSFAAGRGYPIRSIPGISDSI